jgi:hypothetical protein
MIKLLPRLLVIGGLIAGGVYIAQQNGFALPSLGSRENTAIKIPESISVQTQQLSERTKEVSTHVGAVLGKYVDSNEIVKPVEEKKEDDEANSSQPIHEKAFEYGRYQYCQQVIKDYESSNK